MQGSNVDMAGIPAGGDHIWIDRPWTLHKYAARLPSIDVDWLHLTLTVNLVVIENVLLNLGLLNDNPLLNSQQACIVAPVRLDHAALQNH